MHQPVSTYVKPNYQNVNKFLFRNIFTDNSKIRDWSKDTACKTHCHMMCCSVHSPGSKWALLATTIKHRIQRSLLTRTTHVQCTNSRPIELHTQHRQVSNAIWQMAASLPHTHLCVVPIIYNKPAHILPKKCTFPWKDLDPHLYNVSWKHKDLDWFSRFGTANLWAQHTNTHTDHTMCQMCKKGHIYALHATTANVKVCICVTSCTHVYTIHQLHVCNIQQNMATTMAHTLQPLHTHTHTHTPV